MVQEMKLKAAEWMQATRRSETEPIMMHHDAENVKTILLVGGLGEWDVYIVLLSIVYYKSI